MMAICPGGWVKWHTEAETYQFDGRFYGLLLYKIATYSSSLLSENELAGSGSMLTSRRLTQMDKSIGILQLVFVSVYIQNQPTV